MVSYLGENIINNIKSGGNMEKSFENDASTEYAAANWAS